MDNILNELRDRQGWSQGDLAKQLGVSRQTVNALEKGRYDPSLPLAFKIARLFDLKIEEIFSDDGEKK
ncbi:helix-turn-helix transcriptional regulator [Aquisalinus flavus]|uniref:Transcriptional regulator n=1 Tax=Aquisalinus flavus TaxID=1526572 RepID=A0A8J2V699_9PROT|nr:helix-turn-helix transcriptional regulator [Aquisalinus flavus]MBD0425483.1 helix-turn-helix transcriptional regulator [Aquisalinus flavus]UNE48884.1 helix-turn-helix transcriptional regulator [Aquisalinus flavus]GGD15708.1 transcriptional regulator [Aquisalinus flavus]